MVTDTESHGTRTNGEKKKAIQHENMMILPRIKKAVVLRI